MGQQWVRHVWTNHATTLPLLEPTAGALPIAWRRGRPIGRDEFFANVRSLGDALPGHAFAVNLCEDRYLFLVAFAAAALRRQTTLLPANRLDHVVAATRAQYPESYCLTDAIVDAWTALPPEPFPVPPMIEAEHPVAIAFTSGSTGRSEPHLKRWGELVAGAWLAERRFGFSSLPAPSSAGATALGATVIATVPPQHMYGLETSIMLPLVTGLSLHAERPFFPADVAAALAEVPAPRILVTTPAHIRIAITAGLKWPEIALVISATAPLSRQMAIAAEEAFAARVMEIYGFTEAGSVASRRTASENLWTLYDNMRLEGDMLHAAHLSQPLPLHDRLAQRDSRRFALLGRKADLINIAGKRTSLAYLNAVLSEIDGVLDGAFLVPEPEGDRPSRLMAIVVAPGNNRQAILRELAARVDSVFLPRPLVCVDRLPRTEAGKLPRGEMLALVREMEAANTRDDGA